MQEQEISIKAYKQEVEVLTLQMEVPSYDGERANWFPKYADILLKLFNNKRENKDILKIFNYYGSNKIGIKVNLTEYQKGSNKTKQENIDYLIEWFKSGLDLSDEEIYQHVDKGYIYTIYEYENDMEGDNYLELEI